MDSDGLTTEERAEIDAENQAQPVTPEREAQLRKLYDAAVHDLPTILAPRFYAHHFEDNCASANFLGIERGTMPQCFTLISLSGEALAVYDRRRQDQGHEGDLYAYARRPGGDGPAILTIQDD